MGTAEEVAGVVAFLVSDRARWIAADVSRWMDANTRRICDGLYETKGGCIDPKRTAVVLIEFQNDFTSEGGTLHDAVKPVMKSTNMLANTVETVKEARKLGATIIYAPISFTDDYRELSGQPYGILKGVVDSKSFRKGTWGAEIVDALKPGPQDIVVEGKRGLCGFASTNLAFGFADDPGGWQRA